MVQFFETPRAPGLAQLLGGGIGQGIESVLQNALKTEQIREAAKAKAETPMTGYQQIQTALRAKEIEQRERQFEQKPIEEQKKREFGLVSDYAKQIQESEKNVHVKQTALSVLEDAFKTGNLSTFSPDYLADLTGVEAFRTPAGAQALTAGKEFYLGNLGRVKARGVNMWLEKQIKDMQPMIGRSKAANLVAVSALQNEIDLQRKEGDLFNEYMNRADKGEISYRAVPHLVSKEMDNFASETEKQLIKKIKEVKILYGSSGEDRIQVISPEGKPGSIAKSNLKRALQEGYKKK